MEHFVSQLQALLLRLAQALHVLGSLPEKLNDQRSKTYRPKDHHKPNNAGPLRVALGGQYEQPNFAQRADGEEEGPCGER